MLIVGPNDFSQVHLINSKHNWIQYKVDGKFGFIGSIVICSRCNLRFQVNPIQNPTPEGITESFSLITSDCEPGWENKPFNLLEEMIEDD